MGRPPKGSAAMTAAERQAAYRARLKARLRRDDLSDLPELPTSNIGGKRTKRKPSLDQILANAMDQIEGTIWLRVDPMKAAGRLPELFRRLRVLINRLEEESSDDDGVS